MVAGVVVVVAGAVVVAVVGGCESTSEYKWCRSAGNAIARFTTSNNFGSVELTTSDDPLLVSEIVMDCRAAEITSSIGSLVVFVGRC